MFTPMLLEIEPRLRKIKGYCHLPKLQVVPPTLSARMRQLPPESLEGEFAYL